MISVYISVDGNVVFRCSICDETWVIGVQLSSSPFWEVFVGNALLVALGHYEKGHSFIDLGSTGDEANGSEKHGG